ncbi:DUF6468 domain-containing protein [Methylobacterium sp. NEAU 140]|uniref:DUF6468 domain-containing protein n=1 Tax=Methylobacterium sp. NEAU 140 TaxID=3064945 RepID=UPI00273706D0|nr:DUF6468 domain-containing protein [Methylobacterium sp. NEAU 140]MDP4024554.1 DUF6468 domain-containing protein [Methylobacterium sp. NEAU 140]
MSLFVTLFADLLVAVLLAATIVSSVRLSRRIGQLKGDEAALRGTIGDLMVATGTAERAIAGLRAAIDECDRTLNARIETAGVRAAELAAQVEAGEGVIARVGAIVAQMQGARAQPPQGAPAQAHAARVEPPAPPRRPEPPPEPESPNGERLGAAAAAALAMTERALARVRARAA